MNQQEELETYIDYLQVRHEDLIKSFITENNCNLKIAEEVKTIRDALIAIHYNEYLTKYRYGR